MCLWCTHVCLLNSSFILFNTACRALYWHCEGWGVFKILECHPQHIPQMPQMSVGFLRFFWDGNSAEVLRVAATCRRKPPVGIHALVGCQHGRVIWYLSFILLSFIVFHHLALSFAIFHYLSLSFTIFHDLSWSFIVFLCLSSLSFYLIPTWCDLILSPDIWCVTLWIKLNHAECFERLGMLLLTSFPTWHLDQTVNDLSKTIKCEISAWSCMVLQLQPRCTAPSPSQALHMYK
jgi:hypothetical protein